MSFPSESSLATHKDNFLLYITISFILIIHHIYTHVYIFILYVLFSLHFFWSSWQAGCPRILVSNTTTIDTPTPCHPGNKVIWWVSIHVRMNVLTIEELRTAQEYPVDLRMKGEMSSSNIEWHPKICSWEEPVLWSSGKEMTPAIQIECFLTTHFVVTFYEDDMSSTL